MTDIVNDLERVFKYQTCQWSGCVVLSAVDEIERLRKERDELRQQVENIKNGLEGGCYLCEVVGEMNKKLHKERDEARREVCESEKYCKEEAKSRGWDCFKEETQ